MSLNRLCIKIILCHTYIKIGFNFAESSSILPILSYIDGIMYNSCAFLGVFYVS